MVAGGTDNPVTQFAGGVLATLVQSTVMVPVEVIRQRQMIQTGGDGAYTVITQSYMNHNVLTVLWTSSLSTCCAG